MISGIWSQAAACQRLRGASSDRLRRCNLLVQGYHWWRWLELRLWLWEKAAILLMEKSKFTESKVKSMLIIFYDIKGTVPKEFVLAVQTVNSAYYCHVLWRLRKNVWRLRPELWRQKNWPLHHDNAPSHTSFFNSEFRPKTIWLSPPPPCDFFLFSQLKI
jgi:hypothetical protein